jgi:Signal peptidase, peptidase S26
LGTATWWSTTSSGFVLGDNRAAALDSRRFGTVPRADIQAIARQVWFSAHRSDGVRCSRIGQRLE